MRKQTAKKRQRGALKVTNFILHVDEPVISTKKERLIALFLNILFRTLELI